MTIESRFKHRDNYFCLEEKVDCEYFDTEHKLTLHDDIFQYKHYYRCLAPQCIDDKQKNRAKERNKIQ